MGECECVFVYEFLRVPCVLVHPSHIAYGIHSMHVTLCVKLIIYIQILNIIQKNIVFNKPLLKHILRRKLSSKEEECVRSVGGNTIHRRNSIVEGQYIIPMMRDAHTENAFEHWTIRD